MTVADFLQRRIWRGTFENVPMLAGFAPRTFRTGYGSDGGRSMTEIITLIAFWLLIPQVAEATQFTPRPAVPEATAMFAGGCFWGVEAVFEHLAGVRSVTSGYARYQVGGFGTGKSPAIETVRVVYDPARINYRQLLDVFFTVAHDPTSRDRQGPDAGPEYRAVAFFTTEAEREVAEGFLAELTRLRRFSAPVVTEIHVLAGFSVAEAFHQDYGAKHPRDPYIVRNDAPKLIHLRQAFPALYQAQRAP